MDEKPLTATPGARSALIRRAEQVVSSWRRALRFLAPRTKTSLWRAFAQDRVLLSGTAILLLAAWVPLFLTPFVPGADLSLNTTCAELLGDALRGLEPAATYHQVNLKPVPYWTGYLLAMTLGRLMGPLLGAKVLSAFLIGLLPLSTMRLLLALGRDPRLGLWAFLLVWQQNFFAGWHAFILGICLVSIVFAWMLEAETWTDGLRLAPWTALVALTHIQATFLLGVAGAGLCFVTGKLSRRLLVHGCAGLGALLIVVLWLGDRVGLGAQASTVGSSFTFGWHTPAYKLSKVFYYTLDNFSQPDAERAAAIAFVIAALGPLAIGQMRAQNVRYRAAPLILVAAAGVLYVLLWWEVNGPIAHWYTYPRYASVAVLWLLLVPAPRLRGVASIALAPGILAALWLDVKVAEQFAAFGERTRPLLEVIARVPARAKVLPLVLDDNDPDPYFRNAADHALFAYITAVGHGYSPYLWNIPSLPIM
jgi:hypothetical protein